MIYDDRSFIGSARHSLKATFYQPTRLSKYESNKEQKEAVMHCLNCTRNDCKNGECKEIIAFKRALGGKNEEKKTIAN